MISRIEFVISIVLICVWAYSKNVIIQRCCIGGIVICMLTYLISCKTLSFKLHRINTDGINEVLIIDCNLNNEPCLFLLDSGYAGPPVLSRSYLAVKMKEKFRPIDIRQNYNETMAALNNINKDDEHKAINEFVRNSGCLPYTSGCTMRLMGIGSVQEQQADMLMCPMLHIKNKYGFHASPKKMTTMFADMFVTNSLRNSLHILTCDFLLHHSPCVISPDKEELSLSLPYAEYLVIMPTFYMFPAIFSGGSFVIDIHINNTSFKFTVDTGAPGPMSIGKNAAEKLTTCRNKGKQRKLHQGGINGEVVCSEVVEIDVKFCDNEYSVPAFINNMPTDHVDGYVGLGFLRGFDMLISTEQIGFRRNNLEIRNIEYYADLTKEGTCGEKLSCMVD